MDEMPKRKPIRLTNYDYAQNGCYFVTVCTHERQPLLWNDTQSRRGGRPCPPVWNAQPEIPLSIIGKTVEQCWNDMNNIYPNVKADYCVIMPDHFHGIIVINDGLAGGQSRPPLQKIMQGFKSVTTRRCFQYGYRKIWQRSYYEHIIRNETDYIQTVEYIMNNPLKRMLYRGDAPT